MNKPATINYDRLMKTAEEIVRSMVKKYDTIIASYSSGSFARRDMVYGSDFDIAFIADGYPASNKLPPEVTRIIADDVVFEWAFVGREVFDARALLENHTSLCDLAVAKIWFDPQNFFSNLQDLLRKEHSRPELIKVRAMNQLKILENSFDALKSLVMAGQMDTLLTQVFLIVRHAFNIPSVILNKPVTHCRSYLYCRTSSAALGCEEFPALVNKILGADGFTADKVKDALKVSIGILESCGLPKEDVKTYRVHLRAIDYLLDINEPLAAVWPLYFWIVTAWHEAKRDNLADIANNIYESFISIRKELGLADKTNIELRIKIIEEVISKGREMIENHLA
jgi:hypothetical protein